jgi:hypothetical protein
MNNNIVHFTVAKLMNDLPYLGASHGFLRSGDSGVYVDYWLNTNTKTHIRVMIINSYNKVV